MKQKTRYLKILGALLALLAVLAILHLSGGKSALSRYKAELRAGGEKLTLKEIATPPSTDPLQLESRKTLDFNFFTPPTAPVSLMESTGPAKARVAWRGELHFAPGGAGQPAGDWKDFTGKYQNAEPILMKVRQALENPAPDTGKIWDDTWQNITNGPVRNFMRDRNLAQCLFNQEIANLHLNRLDEAIADLHALAGLAQMNRNELTPGSQLIRVSLAGAGLSATWEALQSPGWDEPRLAALQTDWEQVNLMDGVERMLLFERASAAIFMDRIRHSSGPEFNGLMENWIASVKLTHSFPQPLVNNRIWKEQVVPLAYRFNGINEDELVLLRHASGAVDAARLLKANRPWVEVQEALVMLERELDQKIKHDRFGRLRATRINARDFTQTILTVVRTETQRRLTVTIIALKRYQLKHGTPPPELAALTPEFLASVPIDPMSGKALCYRLKADGTFVLYSTGEDGKDDGGDPTPREADGKFGLWEGRDAVWPVAATEEEEKAVEAAAIKK